MSSRLHILHIITDVDPGEAEIMLTRLIQASRDTIFRHSVLCLGSRGALADQIEASGATMLCLNMKGPFRFLPGLIGMLRWIHRERPELVQTWLPRATFHGSLAALLVGRRVLIWTLHSAAAPPPPQPKPIRFFRRALLGLASRTIPRAIVSSSQAALEQAHVAGFKRQKMQIIPYGTDIECFRPSPVAGSVLREALDIPAEAPVVGVVSCRSEEKDVTAFFETALRFQKGHPDTHFILCGPGLDLNWTEAIRYINRSPVPDAFHLLGEREDMEGVYPAFTLLALHSQSEAFPLRVIEAMACGIPAVATDSGDCRHIMADTGLIVPPRDPKRIGRAWAEIFQLGDVDYARLAAKARDRIERFYQIDLCVQRYEALYLELQSRSSGDSAGTAPDREKVSLASGGVPGCANPRNT